MKRFGWCLATSLTTLAGCAETASAPPPPPRCALSVATAVTLSVAADTAIDPATDSGCVSFPNNGSASVDVEYMVVAQSAGGVAGVSEPFALRSATLVAGAPPSPAVMALRAARVGRGGRGLAALRFERRLHQQERLRRALGGDAWCRRHR